jgi:hypothetical protein
MVSAPRLIHARVCTASMWSEAGIVGSSCAAAQRAVTEPASSPETHKVARTAASRAVKVMHGKRAGNAGARPRAAYLFKGEMRFMRPGGIVAVLLLVSCAQTDLGTPCHLLATNNTEVAPVPFENIVQSGNGGCEEFTCVSFQGTAPICSQACDHIGDACGNSLVCQPAMLNPQLLQMLQARTQGQQTLQPGVDDYVVLTAGITDSLYCGPKPSTP